MTRTAQELFSAAYLATMKQGMASSISNGLCRYRGPNGLKCAIGHLVEDDDLAHAMDEANDAAIDTLVKNRFPGLPEEFVEHVFLLRTTQIAHDRSKNPATFREDFTREMRDIAREFSLSLPEFVE